MSDDDDDISHENPLLLDVAGTSADRTHTQIVARDSRTSRAFEAQHTAAVVLEYDGTRFCGWTRQPGLPSIEGELLAAFAALSCEMLEWRCAGRTDAGVHATGQVLSLAWNSTVAG